MEARKSSSVLTDAARRNMTGTPLHTAVAQDNLELVASLIQSGASLTDKNAEGQTAFELACDLGRYECAELFEPFLEHYFDHSGGKFGRLFLHAISSNRIELAKALHKAGASTSARTTADHATALHLAARNFNEPAVKFLLEIGADLKEVDKYHFTPIGDACHERSWECAARMIETIDAEKVSPDKIDQYGLERALSEAIFKENLNMVKLLLEHGARCNVYSPYCGNRMISYCITSSSKDRKLMAEILMLLLAHGADPNMRDKYGDSSYDDAARLNPSMAKILRDYTNTVSPEQLKRFVTEIDQLFLKLQSPDNDPFDTIVLVFLYQRMMHDLFAADIKDLSVQRNLLNLNRAKHNAEIAFLDKQIQALQRMQGDLDHAEVPNGLFENTSIGFHIADHLKRLQIIQYHHVSVKAYLNGLKHRIENGNWQIKSFMEAFSNKWHAGTPKHMREMQTMICKLNEGSTILDTLFVFAVVTKTLQDIKKDRCRHADTSAFYAQELKNIREMHFLAPANAAAMLRN